MRQLLQRVIDALDQTGDDQLFKDVVAARDASPIMTPSEYIHAALRTEMTFNGYEEMAKRIVDPKALRLLHAICGLVTEAGELMDTYKKYAIYGKPIDWTNVSEELGDSQWYTALAIETCGEVVPGTTYESIFEQNIKKLKTRYPGKYSNEAALNRDLQAERRALESNGDEHRQPGDRIRQAGDVMCGD